MNNGNTFNFINPLNIMLARMQVFASMVAEKGFRALDAVAQAAAFHLPNTKTHTQLLSTAATKSFQLTLIDSENDVKMNFIVGKVPSWMAAELGAPMAVDPYIDSLIQYMRRTSYSGRAARGLRVMIGTINKLQKIPGLQVAHDGGKNLLLDEHGLIPTTYYFTSNDPTHSDLGLHVTFSYTNNHSAEPQEVE